ncbi:MAG: hypothetical protein NTV70_01010 [Acidobacteria bacterium]|nr:hypothetical protein [Acidobacteriota bacterium]
MRDNTGLRRLFAPLSAIAGILAASLCCLPLGTFLLAAGSGSAAFLMPPGAQPWLMGFAALMLGVGFWQTYFRKSCRTDRGPFSIAVLWLATLAIGAMWLLPQQVAGLLAGSNGALPASTKQATSLESVEPLRQAFNAASSETRLIALLSPT